MLTATSEKHPGKSNLLNEPEISISQVTRQDLSREAFVYLLLPSCYKNTALNLL